MTALYAVDCSPLQQPKKLHTVLPRLDDSRRRRAERQQHPQKRAQCAAAGLLLTYLFGENGQPPALFHGSRGKPYLFGREDLFFNLSHSGDWVVCAVSDREIGVDAQQFTPCNMRVAQRSFTQTELAWLSEAPDQRFTPLWTAKEAYVKLTGFGLVLPLTSFTVPLPAQGWDEQNHCYWTTLSSDLSGDAYSITVCAAANEPVQPLTRLDIDSL